MRDLSARVLRPELLDDAKISDEEARRSLLDLRRVNRLFGGRRILLDALAREISRYGLRRFTVLDVASGSCDLPLAVLDWAQRRNLEARVFALEYQHRYLSLFREELAAQARVHPFCSDAFRAPVLDHSFDFVTCCHFLHHLSPDRAVHLLSTMSRWARCAVIVSDLERRRLPYYFFRTFSRFFTTSPVSRSDGLTSLAQSFRSEELDKTAKMAGLAGYTVERCWPYRLLLIAETSASAPG